MAKKGSCGRKKPRFGKKGDPKPKRNPMRKRQKIRRKI